MGFRDRLRGKILEEIEENKADFDYSGEPYPAGTYGAVAFGSQLLVNLPPGTVKLVYYAHGRPGRPGKKTWVPSVAFSVKPANEQTPRLTVREPKQAMEVINPVGWSRRTAFLLDVPEPGGQYLAVVPGPTWDRQGHMRFEP